jgi:DNA adenine methylase
VKQLESLFPVHEVYVEPFFGGGALFFGKEPSQKEVVNDLDSTLVADYKRILTAPNDASAYPMPTTEAGQNKFLTQINTSVPAKVVESLLRRCNGFGGNYLEKGKTGVYTDERRILKVTTHKQKLNKMKEYKERLGHATILNQDYRKVIKKYDSAKTFFFLDPPYEMSKGIGYAKGSEDFNFDELASILRTIKGDFLMTINNSPRIRKAFAGFKLYPYVVKGHHSVTSGIGSKDRPELLISNYDLPKGWRKGGMRKGGVSKEDRRVIFNAVGEYDRSINQNDDYGAMRRLLDVFETLTSLTDAETDTLLPLYIAADEAVEEMGRNPSVENNARADREMIRFVVEGFGPFVPEKERPPTPPLEGEEAEFEPEMPPLEPDGDETSPEPAPSPPTKSPDVSSPGTSPDISERPKLTRMTRWALLLSNNQELSPADYVDARRLVNELRELYDREDMDEPEVVARLDELLTKRGRGDDFTDSGSGGGMRDGMGTGRYSFMDDVRRHARKAGYDPDAISSARDGVHKLEYLTPAGRTVKFGRVGYKDFHEWSHLEREGEVEKGFALRKRAVFHKSHEAMKGNWRSNPYSPNNLALSLLW